MHNITFSNIYISRMSTFVTEENITAELGHLGKIIRVDFTPIGKKPGFIENIESSIKSAFVHFEKSLNYSYISCSIADYGSVKIYPSFLAGYEYWILRTIQTPIPGTMMNTAQIVANCRFLENKVEEQASIIKVMESKLEGLQNVVYQLLGGLFNHDSQAGALNHHLSMMLNNKEQVNDTINTSKWTIWPTTRQGDENAERIAILEEEIRAMTNLNIDEEIFPSQDTDTISTHSSMPYLVEDSDESMPELESVSTC